jgi:hypothetical protein
MVYVVGVQVLEVLGHENVKLNKVQVVEMINLLKAEMELEEEEKRLEKMEKEMAQPAADKPQNKDDDDKEKLGQKQ